MFDKINKNSLIDLFITLVKIESPSYQEEKIIRFIMAFLQEQKLKIIFQKVNNTGNIIAYLKGDTKKKPLFFNAHLDTVQPCHHIKPMITERFIRSDRKTILGADDKAALSIFMEGIKYIKKFNIPHPDIYFVFTYAEEQGLVGAKNLDFSLIKAKSGFSFDAGGRVGQVIVSAPTHYQYTILCYGQAAHAGIEPEKGKSAIKIAADVIQKIETGKLDHETTANVGTINGGVATNIVPERVKIEGEVRSRNKSTLLNYLKRLKITLEKIKKKYDGNIDLHLSQAYQSYHFHSDSFLVKKFMEAVKKIKRKPVLVESNGGSDANIFNQNGFQCLNCGIGMTNVHSTKEFIPITELIHGLKLFLSLVISW